MTKPHFIGLAFWYMAIFSVAILMPFEFPPPEQFWESAAQEFAAVRFGSFSIGDGISHAALFIPIGLLLSHVQFYHSSMRFRIALILALLLGIVSELLQLLVDLRTCSGTDLIMDYTGLGLGLWAGIAWHRSSELRDKLDRWFSPRVLAAILVGVIGLYIYSFIPVKSGFENWEPDFPLLMGSEKGGSRLWHGDLYEVALFDRALDAYTASSLSAGETDLRDLHPLIHYDFSAADLQYQAGKLLSIAEHTQRYPELQLQLTEAGRVDVLPNGGVRLAEGAALWAQGLPDALYQRLIEAGQLSLFVRFRAATRTDRGPARIISLSDSIVSRNLMLGQSRETIEFRVRTPFNGTNGDKPALIGKGCVTPLEAQSTVTVFSGVESHLYVNGALCGSQVYDRLSTSGPTYLVVPWNTLGTMGILFLGWSIFAIVYLAALRQRPDSLKQKSLIATVLSILTVVLLVSARYALR